MKKTALVLSLLAVVACGRPVPSPEIIAHRGFWNTPEPSAKNSVAALRAAIDLGCWGNEFDVWVTSDNVPVVFHDNVTASGIEIQGATLDSLLAGAELLSNGERIPTLDEYLAAWGHAPIKLILELKAHRDAAADDHAAGVILEHLRSFGVTPDEVEYISFSPHAVRSFIARDCGSPVSYLNGDLTPAEAQSQLGATGIDYQMKVLRSNPEWITQAHELGMTVNVWTAVKPEDMEYFIAAGVDYITTDAPDVLKPLVD